MSELRVSDELEAHWHAASLAVVGRPRVSCPVQPSRLERAVDHLPETMCVIGADGEVNHISAAVRTLLSREPWSFAATNALDYVHPADRGRAVSWFEQLHGSPGSSSTILLQLLANDHSWVTVEASGHRIAGSPPHEIVCTLRPIDAPEVPVAPSRWRRASDGVVTRDHFARTVRDLQPQSVGRPLVVFVDVDDFDNIRRAYGEQAAEDVVVKVRAVLQLARAAGGRHRPAVGGLPRRPLP